MLANDIPGPFMRVLYDCFFRFNPAFRNFQPLGQLFRQYDRGLVQLIELPNTRLPPPQYDAFLTNDLAGLVFFGPADARTACLAAH